MKSRLKGILKLVKQNTSLSVSDLSNKLAVSEVTIRKDLSELEKGRYILRTHGRATILNETSVPPFHQRETIEMDEKHFIAREAAKLIDDGDSIIIDAGTTPLAVAKFIKNKDLSIVTNSLPVGMELHDFKGTVSLTSGDIINSSMALYGPDTQNFLENIRVNKLILGTSGFRPDFGFTTSSSIEAAVKQRMIKCAQKVILVADHTKFTRIKIAMFAPFSDIQTVITSDLTSKEAIKTMEDEGIEVIIVNLSENGFDEKTIHINNII